MGETDETVGMRLRRAATQAVSGSGRRSEESMYPTIVAVVDDLCPPGFHAQVLRPERVGRFRPDMSIVDRSGGVVAHIEVKHASTVADVFASGLGGGDSQAVRYRADRVAVWVTDAIGWSDITVVDDLSQPICNFADTADGDDIDGVAVAQLRAACWRVCGVRPHFTLDTAVAAVGAVIAAVDHANIGSLTSGWEVVRDALGLPLDDGGLDRAGAGEIVAFTLLAIAIELDPLTDDNFVDDATREWRSDADRWRLERLPSAMAASLRLFREADNATVGGVIGDGGWVTIRSIAAWIITEPTRHDRWRRLSELWDTHLQVTDRRANLGSWQTPHQIAAYQAAQTDTALHTLEYSGLGDSRVTIVDPCCGTGVYLEAVADTANTDGVAVGSFNAAEDTDGGFGRLVGIDVSATAVAATHIRMTSTGVRPALYMTDTLATGADSNILRLFDTSGQIGANPIVASARNDHNEASRWASRDRDRPPVVAVVGNPPYLRAGLTRDDYSNIGWRVDVFDRWRPGSGGHGGGIFDSFVAFWAWACSLCHQPHDDLLSSSERAERFDMLGVVSYITNRHWLVGSTYQTMRAWIASRAADIVVTDFGSGARGDTADSWSDQPFPIQTGTAIVTIIFNPSSPRLTHIDYRKARWVGETIEIIDRTRVEVSTTISGRGRTAVAVAEPFIPVVDTMSFLSGVDTVIGVITAEDRRWIRTVADRDYTRRYAYRAFDNRWAPTRPPERVKPGVTPLRHQASEGARWREKTLTGPHDDHVAAGGWYLLSQAKSAKPGPALHATRHIFDFHAFKGSEGGKRKIRVSTTTPIPVDYQRWAHDHDMSSLNFWLYLLAAAHHRGYWTLDHPYAQQLAHNRVTPPLTDDRDVIDEFCEIGQRLIDVWSLDTITPAPHRYDRGLGWVVDGEHDLYDLRVHGRPVLARWCKDRPDRHEWSDTIAREYARSVAALGEIWDTSHHIADLLDDPTDQPPTHIGDRM